MNAEFQDMSQAARAADETLMSPEADGIVTMDATQERLEEIHQSCAHLVRKPYPQTFEDIIAFAKARYPEYNWTEKSKYSWKKLRLAIRDIKSDLQKADENDEPKKKILVSGHTDYALVIAAAYESKLILDGKFLYMVQPNHAWRQTDAEELHTTVRDFLHSRFAPQRFRLKNGKVAAGDDDEQSVPRRLKDNGFLSAVRKELKSYVRGKAPPFDSFRHLLAFNCGTVWDFKEGTLKHGTPNMNILHHLPFDYDEFDRNLTEQWTDLVKEIIDHWKAGKGDLRPEPEAGVDQMLIGRSDLATRVEEMCSKVDFLGVLLSICHGRVDDMLYLLQHFVRMMSSFPRMCELLYIHGPPKAGKDVIAMLLQSFFGDADGTGCCTTLPRDYFQKGPSTRGAEDSQPMIHSVMRSKAVLVPEVPKGVTDMEKVKPLCEQQGVRIATRTHGADPERVNPKFQIVMFSNHLMDIGENPDGGQARRCSVMGLTNVHNGTETPDRPDLKEYINEGHLQLQMFHMTRVFYDALSLYGTNIRRPTRIERETKQVTGELLEDDQETPEQWINNAFEKCSIAESSKETLVKKMFAAHFDVRPREVKNKMIEFGFKVEQNDGKGHRFVKFTFTGDTEPKPVRCKP